MNSIKQIIAEMEAAIEGGKDFTTTPSVSWMKLIIWRDTLKAYISVND